MNINIRRLEEHLKDEAVCERLGFEFYYASGKLQDPHFTAKWDKVPEEVKQRAQELGRKVVIALVTDWTTPGCGCSYCQSLRQGKKPKNIMCSKVWRTLSSEEQNNISESCGD